MEQENEDKKVTKVLKAWEKPKRRKKGVTKATTKNKIKKKPQAKQTQQVINFDWLYGHHGTTEERIRI